MSGNFENRQESWRTYLLFLFSTHRVRVYIEYDHCWSDLHEKRYHKLLYPARFYCQLLIYL